MPRFTQPKSVHVELTDKCNAECPVCVRRLGGGKLNSIIQNIELGVDYFKNSLGFEFCANVEHWQFCGTKVTHSMYGINEIIAPKPVIQIQCFFHKMEDLDRKNCGHN